MPTDQAVSAQSFGGQLHRDRVKVLAGGRFGKAPPTETILFAPRNHVKMCMRNFLPRDCNVR